MVTHCCCVIPRFTGRVLEAWLESLEGQDEFAQSLPYEDEKSRALSSLGSRIMAKGVGAASELVAGSEDPLVQRRLASRIVGEWTK